MTLDLSMLRGDNDVVAGFSVSPGLYQSQITGPDGKELTIQMPVLDLNLIMANGKTKHRVSIAPDSVLALVATLSNWALQVNQQGASPPAPPSGLVTP